MATPSAAEYWSCRASAGTLAAFGASSLGEHYNRALFQAKARALASAIGGELLPPPAERRCLDAGVGHGWLLRSWQRQGVGRLDGLEAVPEVAAKARRQAPRARIRVADLAGWRPQPAERYDLVCALDVLFYLTDDDAFEHALSGLATAVAPGGLLVVSDLFPGLPAGNPQVRPRPWPHYAKVVGRLGLAPRRRRPIFAIAHRGLGAAPGWRDRVYRHLFEGFWNLARARSPLARPLEAGAALAVYGLDAVLMALGGPRWGSQEIAVWRRPVSPGPPRPAPRP